MSANFSDFSFPPNVEGALTDMSFVSPTPVQQQAIPLVLAGNDVLACAQTGTGKTAAFALPLLVKMVQGSTKSAVVLAPTRELAEQIAAFLDQLTMKLRTFRPALVIGGTSMFRQVAILKKRPRFVIATPGRLMDHLNRGSFDLEGYEYVVLDEADRMLDMGFEPQLREIFSKLPKTRQTLLFSATLPHNILQMSQRYLKDPKRISIGESHTPIERIKQRKIETSIHDKQQTLIREIDQVAGSILVFTRTKSRTESLAKLLRNSGHRVSRIHGDRSQKQRSEAIQAFRDGEIRILVATDIAARGLDIPHIEHVVNYDLPMCPEDYVHRIGRTARNGREGQALSFVTPEDRAQWQRINRLMAGPSRDTSDDSRSSGGGRNQGRPSFNEGRPQRPFRGGGRNAGGPSRGSSSRPSAAGSGGASRPSFKGSGGTGGEGGGRKFRPARPARGGGGEQRSSRW